MIENGVIIIIEDDVLVADNTAFVLTQGGYKNVFVCDNLSDILEIQKKKKISLIISDINLHGINSGPSIVKEIQQKTNAPVIYLTAFSEDQILNEVLTTNSVAYVLKPFTDRQLLVAVQIAFKQIENNYTGDIDKPTKRELEIIEFVAKGLSNKEIADSLFLSEHTIKAHRRNLIRKFALRSSSELIAMAARMKWIHLS